MLLCSYIPFFSAQILVLVRLPVCVLNMFYCYSIAFRLLPYPMEKGHLFHPYPACTEAADKELLPGNNNRI